jgi:hypothetical protein
MARIYISKHGFILRPIVRRWVLYGLVLAVAIVISILLLLNRDAVGAPETYAGLAAVGAVIFGYWQWREGRHEEAVDHFFERLNHATNTFLASMRAKSQSGTNELDEQYRTMLAREYVYAELNNLEYSLEKYRLGYMRPELAARALRTFQDRCRFSKNSYDQQDFAAQVLQIVRNARSISRDFSYNELTLKVALSALTDAGNEGPQLSNNVGSRDLLMYFLDLKREPKFAVGDRVLLTKARMAGVIGTVVNVVARDILPVRYLVQCDTGTVALRERQLRDRVDWSTRCRELGLVSLHVPPFESGQPPRRGTRPRSSVPA